MTLDKMCDQLVTLLDKSVQRNLAEGLLLSGGLDTSILAYLACRYQKPRCYTVALQDAPAPDIEYAKLVAQRLGLKHQIFYLDTQQLTEAIRAVVKVMRCFDPMEIRNSATIYTGLTAARDDGVNTVMTGDGCDELFAGYSFVFKLDKPERDAALRRMWRNMRFASIYIARELGMEARIPFLDPEVQALAQSLDSDLMVGRRDGQLMGKWVVRCAFESMLPAEITWRTKTPIEYGSGTTTLPAYFDALISDHEFEQKRRKYRAQDKVTIRDKEQLFYYQIYRSMFEAPHSTKAEGKICPQCQAAAPPDTAFCRTCGAYPI